MKSMKELECRERIIYENRKKSIVAYAIALLISLALLAESIYFCCKHANPPAIIFTVLLSFTTLVMVFLLWSSIKIFRENSDNPE